MSPEVLGGFEHQVLLAILRLGEEAYTVPVVLELESLCDREVAPAAVYISLRRLEKRGLVESRLATDGETPGRPRRYFRLTDEGIDRLRESRQALARLWDGVEGRLDGRP